MFLISRPERIGQICKRFNVDPDEILENIKVARAYTVDHLNQLLLHAAKQMFVEEYSLLVVDSIMAPFRVDYTGIGELSEIKQVLWKNLIRLIKIIFQNSWALTFLGTLVVFKLHLLIKFLIKKF